MFLNLGGNDLTEFLYVLLQKINFPCQDLDLARSYDWNVIEDLKTRLCTLAEVSPRQPMYLSEQYLIQMVISFPAG